MRIVAIIVAASALVGCGLAAGYQIGHMTPDELTKLSDADLCHPYTGNNPAITAERQKRDLADCGGDHIYCHSLGLKTGTDAYVQCRLKAREMAADAASAQQQQAATQASQAWQKALQPGPVTTTIR
jgi:hypothetical protein